MAGVRFVMLNEFSVEVLPAKIHGESVFADNTLLNNVGV